MKILVLKESLLQSILSDVFTFACLLFSVWFNFHYCGGSYFLNGVLLVMFILMIMSRVDRNVNKIYTVEDLLKYAEEQKRSQNEKSDM